MHPLGCFGSSLAFAPETAVCQGCTATAECAALVEARRPRLLQLLSRFTDNKGEKVAVHWLTPVERQNLKGIRKANALAAAEESVYGDRSKIAAIKARLDKRAHATVDQMTISYLNLGTAPLDSIAAFSTGMATVVELLKARPHTIEEITDGLALRCSYSASTAKREAHTLASILTSGDRAKRVGPLLELT